MNMFNGIWMAGVRRLTFVEIVLLLIILGGMLFLGFLGGREFGNPLERIFISMRSRVVVLVALIVVTGAVISFMRSSRLDGFSEAPYKIVSYELAKTADKAIDILKQWDSAGRVNDVRKEIKIDFVFIPSYVLLIGFGCFWLADAQKTTWISSVGLMLGYAMPVAGLLDVIENFELLRMLDGGVKEFLAKTAFWAALPKLIVTLWFGAGFIIVALLVVILATALFNANKH